MEHIGSTEKLKKSIESHYKDEISKLKKEAEKKISVMKSKKKDLLDKIISKIKEDTETEVQNEKVKTISSKIMDAKADFEKKRLEYIEKIFESIKKNIIEISSSKDYISWLKTVVPKDTKIKATANSDEYKKHFPDLDIKIDKEVIGLRFSIGNINYDYTLTTLIDTKKDQLSSEINRILFGEINV